MPNSSYDIEEAAQSIVRLQQTFNAHERFLQLTNKAYQERTTDIKAALAQELASTPKTWDELGIRLFRDPTIQRSSNFEALYEKYEKAQKDFSENKSAPTAKNAKTEEATVKEAYREIKKLALPPSREKKEVKTRPVISDTTLKTITYWDSLEKYVRDLDNTELHVRTQQHEDLLIKFLHSKEDASRKLNPTPEERESAVQNTLGEIHLLNNLLRFESKHKHSIETINLIAEVKQNLKEPTSLETIAKRLELYVALENAINKNITEGLKTRSDYYNHAYNEMYDTKKSPWDLQSCYNEALSKFKVNGWDGVEDYYSELKGKLAETHFGDDYGKQFMQALENKVSLKLGCTQLMANSAELMYPQIATALTKAEKEYDQKLAKTPAVPQQQEAPTPKQPPLR